MSDQIVPPRDSKEFEPHNRLLSALSGTDLQSLHPHIEVAPLASASDEPLTHVYFVETGVVSLLTALENRVTIGRPRWIERARSV
jgi:hypothetical protein